MASTTQQEISSSGFDAAGIRQVDEDRWLASRFAPQSQRACIEVMLALFHEFHIARNASLEPMVAAIRLAWWRERLEAFGTGGSEDRRGHPVLEAARHAFAGQVLPRGEVLTALECHQSMLETPERQSYLTLDLSEAEARALWSLTSGELPASVAALSRQWPLRQSGKLERDTIATLRAEVPRLNSEQWATIGYLSLLPVYARQSGLPSLLRRQWCLTMGAARGRL